MKKKLEIVQTEEKKLEMKEDITPYNVNLKSWTLYLEGRYFQKVIFSFLHYYEREKIDFVSNYKRKQLIFISKKLFSLIFSYLKTIEKHTRNKD
jgi:hypothetical protein